SVVRRRASASNANASAIIEAAPITALAAIEDIGNDHSQAETRISASKGRSSNHTCPLNPSIWRPQIQALIHTAASAANKPIAAPRNQNLAYPNGTETAATTAPNAAMAVSAFWRPAAIKPKR